MAYTAYKFDPKWIKKRVKELKASLKANKNTDDFLGYGIGVICQRLEADPKRYRDYGPYWWALKKLIAKYATDQLPGLDEMDETIAKEYRGKTDEETLVMADEFRNDYLNHFFLYTNEFMLDPDSPDLYLLSDPDYEKLAFIKQLGL
ncbi:MAG: hypothetical protein LUC43_07845 [Burkholderiales bacterium]|nr:hypothetical protein [Burkholderiales bacterium]